ncbi:MAG: PAS domain-containing protein [Deltaproteobacteria bacterium]|nr:PAS domain-containing protein [Deltaproteobacteria bacterium]
MHDRAVKASKKPATTDEFIAKWQRIVDLMARTVGVPAGLIMRVDPPQIEVFISSATEGNPYKQGERTDLNTGLYCETVMKHRTPLLVPDALKDPQWKHNPDVALGMTYYLGFPLVWPDGEIFGTICVLDTEENLQASTYKDLLYEFQQIIEGDLRIMSYAAAREQLVRLELEEAELAYRIITDFTYDWEYWVNPDETIRYMSSSAERITGYTNQQFIDNPALRWEIIIPEDRNIWDRHYEQERRDPRFYEIQFRIRRKDGEIRWIEHACQPVTGPRGEFWGLRVSNRDITARKEVEEALRRSEQSLTEAQRIAHLGNWDWDIVTDELRWSNEVYRIFGLQPREFGATYEAFLASVHPDDRDAVTKAVEESLADPHTSYSIEHRVIRPDGSERMVHERGEVTFDETGKAVHMIGTIHDITELKKAELESYRARRELLRMERVSSMGELTASLAHELNQPLTAILSNAGAALRFLQSDRLDPGELREILQDIINDDKRAGDIIRSVRAMLKEEEREREAIPINNMLRGMFSLFHSEAVIRNIEIEMDLVDPSPVVRVDTVQIQQVLINLAMNAAEAVSRHEPEDRKIVLQTRPVDPGAVQVAVRDFGPGIGEKKLARIFDPFFTTKRSGLGMGLSISRSIIEAHGGRIWVENNPDNRGVTFYFELPVA